MVECRRAFRLALKMKTCAVCLLTCVLFKLFYLSDVIIYSFICVTWAGIAQSVV
jgi:hypothetical protein